MKRRLEEIAKSEFDALLRRLFPNAVVAWEEVPQAQEPPDWYLQVGSERYAVEATSIFEHIPTISGTVSSRTVSVTLQRFIDEIEAIAVRDGILTGAYTVWLYPVPDFSTAKRSLADGYLIISETPRVFHVLPEPRYGKLIISLCLFKSTTIRRNILLRLFLATRRLKAKCNESCQET